MPTTRTAVDPEASVAASTAAATTEPVRRVRFVSGPGVGEAAVGVVGVETDVGVMGVAVGSNIAGLRSYGSGRMATTRP
jgi:hypothetical protein